MHCEGVTVVDDIKFHTLHTNTKTCWVWPDADLHDCTVRAGTTICPGNGHQWLLLDIVVLPTGVGLRGVQVLLQGWKGEPYPRSCCWIGNKKAMNAESISWVLQSWWNLMIELNCMQWTMSHCNWYVHWEWCSGRALWVPMDSQDPVLNLAGRSIK